jgi:hypothetical protein
MNELNALLSASIEHYEALLAMFETINDDKENADQSTLQTRCTELLRLQGELALADGALGIAMQSENSAPVDLSLDNPLITRRQTLMGQAFTHNRSLLATIHNIQSLLVHEMKEIQCGRAALNGYRQTTSTQQGSILNASR